MNIALVIITCSGREKLLTQTLASLLSTDIGSDVHPLVICDTSKFERKQERQEHNSLAALEEVLVQNWEAEVILFCEDDIIFNRHLRWNLERWEPLRNYAGSLRPGNAEPSVKDLFFGSLYDPGIPELQMYEDKHYFVAHPNRIYGSQCFVLSRAVAEYIVAHWWEQEGMQDIKMSRLAARLCPVHYHHPSLVQHVGYQSAWGGPFHDSKSFDWEFKTEVKP